jgi:hypothetical protein
MHMLRPVDSPGDDLPWTGLFTGMIIGNFIQLQYTNSNNAYRGIIRVLRAFYTLPPTNSLMSSSWQVSDL